MLTTLREKVTKKNDNGLLFNKRSFNTFYLLLLNFRQYLFFAHFVFLRRYDLAYYLFG